MSSADSETASSVPWRSRIEPRGPGRAIRFVCWVAAACLSAEARTTPNHDARRAANPRRPTKTTKRREMRRSTSRTGYLPSGATAAPGTVVAGAVVAAPGLVVWVGVAAWVEVVGVGVVGVALIGVAPVALGVVAVGT